MRNFINIINEAENIHDETVKAISFFKNHGFSDSVETNFSDVQEASEKIINLHKEASRIIMSNFSQKDIDAYNAFYNKKYQAGHNRNYWQEHFGNKNYSSEDLKKAVSFYEKFDFRNPLHMNNAYEYLLAANESIKKEIEKNTNILKNKPGNDRWKTSFKDTDGRNTYIPYGTEW